MLNCLIVEDDYAFAIDTKIKVEEIGLNVIKIVSSFSDIQNTLDTEKVDIILSDVKLGNNRYAFDFFKDIDELPPIIFFSGVKDATLYTKSKSSNPYIYLSKPFDDVTLKSAIEGALRSKTEELSKKGEIQRSNQNIFVRANGQMINLVPSEVNFIQSEGNYVFINTIARKIAIRSSIKNVLGKIDSNSFLQVHRGYAVNVFKINEFNIGENYLQINTERIPVGRKYKKELKLKLKSI